MLASSLQGNSARALIAVAAVTLLAAVGGLGSPAAEAGDCQDTPVTVWPVGSGGNGHAYQGVCVPETINWADARLAADGMGGHLVTLTSDAENTFVFNMISDTRFWIPGAQNCWTRGPHIGGIQDDGQEPDAGWGWVTGESWNYTSWDSENGQPGDNGNVDENRAHYANGSCVDETPVDRWHDILPTYTSLSYVVEFEPEGLLGDTDCDDDVDAVDALHDLQDVAGFEPDAACLELGDVQCDGDRDAVDALGILTHVAALPAQPQEPGCVPVGDPIVIL